VQTAGGDDEMTKSNGRDTIRKTDGYTRKEPMLYTRAPIMGKDDRSKEPFLSIIVATKGSGENLEECVRSMIGQSNRSIQLIIQECRIDRSLNRKLLDLIDEAWSKGIECSYECYQDKGIADAWNRAIRRSKGRWVLFLGSDDELYSPTTIQELEPILQEAEEKTQIVYGLVEMVSKSGSALPTAGRKWEEISRRFFRCEEFIPHQGVLHHTDALRTCRAFNTDYRILADQEMLMRIIEDQEPWFLERTIISRMRVGGLSTNRRFILSATLEAVRLSRSRRNGRVSPTLALRACKASIIQLIFNMAGNSATLEIMNFVRRFILRQPPLLY
jgi:glycosyltransferase involved in cell wall biosynthesis